MLALASALSSHAATLVDDATLVGDDTTPVVRGFEIPQDGRYEVRLTDVGFPADLQSIQVAITVGDRLVTSLAAEGTIEFDATAGQHELQIAGIASAASGFGSFALQILPAAGGSLIVDYSDSIETPTTPPPGQTTLQTQFIVQSAGTYSVTVADVAYPEALAQIDLLVTRGGVEYARLDAANPVKEFTADPGTYEILGVAQAGATTSAGLFGVRVENTAGGQPLLVDSYPVGFLGSAEVVSLATDATYMLTVTDLEFPTALSVVGAVIMRGSTVLISRSETGSSSFNATSGDVKLYSLPVAGAQPAAGVQLVEIRRGAELVVASPYVATPPAAADALSVLTNEVTIPASSAYRATVTDFDFPGTLVTLESAVYQDGVSLGRRTGPGPIDFQGTPGRVLMLIAAQPNPSVGAGLFGLQIAAEPSGPVIHDTTQAVGALFQSRTVDIPSSESYDVSLTDLGFPAPFTEMSVAVTRGTERVGFIFGGGRFSFDATAGTYFLNFITDVNPATRFGTYGLTVETTPPAPVVTLTAGSASVTSGESTTLSWSATNATSCTASGGWSGAKATTGTESVGPLTVNGTFTITCTGLGGSDSETVTVSIRAPESSGGGGPIHPLELLLLLVAMCSQRRRAGPVA